MARPAHRIATPDDLRSVPDHRVGELLAGEVVVSPRPSPIHSFAQQSLGDEVTGPFQKGRGGPGGWIFLTEPELELSGDVVVPDIAGWRRERAGLFHGQATVSIAPDWVCEVLSPRTEARDRGVKARVYARSAVSHYWLLNPTLRTLEVWRLEGGRWVVVELFEGEAVVNAEPFEAIAMELGVLWAPGVGG